MQFPTALFRANEKVLSAKIPGTLSLPTTTAPTPPTPQNVERNILEYVDRVRYSLKLIQNTVDKLNKSKLTGNVNVNKMVLPLVCCWWWSCSFCLAENATTNHRKAL